MQLCFCCTHVTHRHRVHDVRLCPEIDDDSNHYSPDCQHQFLVLRPYDSVDCSPTHRNVRSRAIVNLFLRYDFPMLNPDHGCAQISDAVPNR